VKLDESEISLILAAAALLVRFRRYDEKFQRPN
jgi:hypothetical protein